MFWNRVRAKTRAGLCMGGGGKGEWVGTLYFILTCIRIHFWPCLPPKKCHITLLACNSRIVLSQLFGPIGAPMCVGITLGLILFIASGLTPGFDYRILAYIANSYLCVVLFGFCLVLFGLILFLFFCLFVFDALFALVNWIGMHREWTSRFASDLALRWVLHSCRLTGFGQTRRVKNLVFCDSHDACTS